MKDRPDTFLSVLWSQYFYFYFYVSIEHLRFPVPRRPVLIIVLLSQFLRSFDTLQPPPIININHRAGQRAGRGAITIKLRAGGVLSRVSTHCPFLLLPPWVLLGGNEEKIPDWRWNARDTTDCTGTIINYHFSVHFMIFLKKQSKVKYFLQVFCANLLHKNILLFISFRNIW